MYYLKLFQNHSDYQDFVSGDTMVKPNVSHCIEENEVHYNPFIDPFNGHAYVDLGLPSGTLWAKTNVGANSETDAGLYFAWGETEGYTASQVGTGEGQKAFDVTDYKFVENGEDTIYTKYNATDNKTLLELTDDAAAANMGGDWHMPNQRQCYELFKKTKNGFVTNAGAFTQYAWNNDNDYSSPTSTTATISGWDTAGYFFFKSDVSDMNAAITNGDYLFIPAAGGCEDGVVDDVGISGGVWASALNSENVKIALGFYFYSGGAGVGSNIRCFGKSVRGVVGYLLSQIQLEGYGYNSSDGGYEITLTEPIDSNATDIRLCATSNMENGGYTEYPLTSISEDVNLFIQSPRITCSDLDIKYELNNKTYLISGWNISCIQ